MKPNELYLNQSKQFWAYVRSISQEVGYTVPKRKQIKVPSVGEMVEALRKLDLDSTRIVDETEEPTPLGGALRDYFVYRASVLNTDVEPQLQDKDRARMLFDKVRAAGECSCPLPMNKQKDAMKAHAFFTGVVNMLIESNTEGMPCDFDPKRLTTFTLDGAPLRTLARRVDGAFPSHVDTVAIWEIKEYYYTTTFGSRVADGVYESLLDGMELEELYEKEKRKVLHYLMVDGHFTWWESGGRPYLCRIVDMLHMGYVDEVLFGAEVIERLPSLVKEWVVQEKKNQRAVK
jgi:signal recognition particle subunit SEC65